MITTNKQLTREMTYFISAKINEILKKERKEEKKKVREKERGKEKQRKISGRQEKKMTDGVTTKNLILRDVEACTPWKGGAEVTRETKRVMKLNLH